LYQHVLDEMQDELADAISDVLNGADQPLKSQPLFQPLSGEKKPPAITVGGFLIG